jgi:dipeptidyl aminopeptidase/acylaminoacyl peptidase
LGGLSRTGSGRRSGLLAVLSCLALVLAALIGLAGKATAQDGPGPVVPIQFESGGAKLRGSLYEPAGKGPFPAIVVVHGASAGVRGYPLYRHLVRSMNAIGVAVLVYDRRGSGQSEGALASTDYDGLARDVVAGVDALRVRGKIDRRRIGLWGP